MILPAASPHTCVYVFLLADFIAQGKSLSKLGENVRYMLSGVHAYTHSIGCQHLFSPGLNLGFGIEDGETIERLWAETSRSIGPTRYMSLGNRQDAITLRLDYVARKKLGALPRMIEGRITKALTRIAEVNDKLRTLGRDENVAQPIYSRAYVEQLIAERNQGNHHPGATVDNLELIPGQDDDVIEALHESVGVLESPADAFAIGIKFTYLIDY
jgi:hypothetical protein